MAEEALRPAAYDAGRADAEYTAHSPANSDKTIVPSMQPNIMAVEPVPIPGSGGALFSTDLGRRPPLTHRHPTPPLIVRSNIVQSVVDAAKHWYLKYPRQYHCIFPQCGYTINDLWDNADIKLDRRAFLEEVLKFISHDNAYRAKAFGLKWSQDPENEERLHLLAGDLTSIYDPNNHLAIVDKIFVRGEANVYPHTFLWHAAHMMRTSMWTLSQKQQAAKVAANVHGIAKAESNEADEAFIESTTDAERKPAVTAEDKEAQPVATSREGLQVSSTIDSTVTTPGALPTQGPSAMSTPPQLLSQPLRGYPSQPVGPLMGSCSIGTSYGYPPPLRNPKSRIDRSGSGSYQQPLQTHSLTENVRMPSGHQSRQPSGHISAAPSPCFGPHIPMGHEMANSLNPMPSFPQPLMSSSMSNQMPFPPGGIMYQGVAPQHTGPFLGSPVMGAAYPHPPLRGPDPRGFPIGDMTNNVRYQGNIPMQSMDTRGGRRGSQNYKQRELYNPYDKPDWANVPSSQGTRKAGRNSFSNPSGRGRKFSVGSYGRSSYDQYNANRADNNFAPTQGRTAEAPSSRFNRIPSNPRLTEDKVYGCHDTFIGEKNMEVKELWVGDLPADVTAEGLKALFEGVANITVELVNLHTTNPSNKRHAFVHFSNASDARIALNAPNLRLGGRAIVVKVPHRYFRVLDQDVPPKDGKFTGPDIGTYGSAPLAADVRGRKRMSSLGQQGTAPIAATSDATVQYSPQDARSDLPKISRQQQNELPVSRDSPESRKSKKKQLEIEKSESGNQSVAGEVISEPKKSEKAVEKLEAGNVKSDEQRAVAIAVIVEELAADVVQKGSPTKSLTTASQQVSTRNVGPEANVADPLQNLSQQVPSNIKDMTEDISQIPRSSSPTQPTRVQSPLQNVSSTFSKISRQSSPPQGTFGEGGLERKSNSDLVPSPQRDDNDDAASDDEQKNDMSFHSAQESQSESAQIDEVVANDPDIAALSKAAAADATAPGDQEQGAALSNEETKSGNEGIITAQQKDSHESTVKVVTSAAETGKKLGAKHTESLHPFAMKPSKSESKKAKEQKKKEKKRREKEKQEEEKREKESLKAETRMPPTKATNTPGAKSLSGVSDTPLDSLPTAKSPTRTLPELAVVTNTESSNNTNRVGKGNITVKGPPDASVETTPRGDESIGKGGKQPMPPTQIKAVIQNPVVQPSLSVQTTQPEIASALFHENSSVHDNTKTLGSPQRSPSKGAVPKISSKKPPPVAVPNPQLLGTQTKPSSSNVSKPESVAKSDVESVASSSTLRNSISQPMSPSPTTPGFVTPTTGTPTTEVPPQPVKPPKKNKHNNRKKGKKMPSELMDTLTPADASQNTKDDGTAFHDQLSQVDYIIQGSNAPSSYYDRRDAEAAAQAEGSSDKGKDSKDSKDSKEVKGSAPFVLREIQAYMAEKTAIYLPMAKKALQDNQNNAQPLPPKQLTFEEMDKLIHGSTDAYTKGMKRLEEDARLPEGHPDKVPKAGKMPFFTAEPEE